MIIASDVEGTLTTGETWRALGRYYEQSERKSAYRRFFAMRMPGFLLTKLGLRSEKAFKTRWIEDLARFFTGMDGAELAQVAAWVVEHELWPKRRPEVVAELRRYQKAGHTLVLASGVYQPVLDALAERVGAVALGTPLEFEQDRATGRLIGEVNTGEAKRERLTSWLEGRALNLAYGDTDADVPMLERANEAVVVHPDARLSEVARARSWRVFDGTS